MQVKIARDWLDILVVLSLWMGSDVWCGPGMRFHKNMHRLYEIRYSNLLGELRRGTYLDLLRGNSLLPYVPILSLLRWPELMELGVW